MSKHNYHHPMYDAAKAKIDAAATATGLRPRDVVEYVLEHRGARPDQARTIVASMGGEHVIDDLVRRFG